jgi:GT2 family glycosyltransferase
MRYNTELVAVIVLYKTKLGQSKSFLSLSASLMRPDIMLDLVVYDNSPEYNADEIFDQYPNWNITYCPDEDNGGVSKAYNTAAKIAKGKNRKWLLLLDQDTSFTDHAISVYLDAFKKYPDEKLFAPIMLAGNGKIISPCYFRLMRGFSSRYVKTGVNSLRTFSIINCAMCIDVDAFIKNNGYNEQLKLDFSDHDFIRRFKRSNGDRFIVVDLKVSHQLSSETRNSVTGDMVRFDYYLEGAKHMSATAAEKFLLMVNALLRAVKLSLIHRNAAFVTKWFKWFQ